MLPHDENDDETKGRHGSCLFKLRRCWGLYRVAIVFSFALDCKCLKKKAYSLEYFAYLTNTVLFDAFWQIYVLVSIVESKRKTHECCSLCAHCWEKTGRYVFSVYWSAHCKTGKKDVFIFSNTRAAIIPILLQRRSMLHSALNIKHMRLSKELQDRAKLYCAHSFEPSTYTCFANLEATTAHTGCKIRHAFRC